MNVSKGTCETGHTSQYTNKTQTRHNNTDWKLKLNFIYLFVDIVLCIFIIGLSQNKDEIYQKKKEKERKNGRK